MEPVKIKNISNDTNKELFTVKGRVNPHPMVVDNSNGNGRHLFAILFDKTGSIRITAFNSACDTIIDKLKTDHVISIHGSIWVQEVEEKYKFLDHKYELLLNYDSIIEIMYNDTENIVDFPKHKFCSEKDLMHINIVNCTRYVDITGTYYIESLIDSSSPCTVHKIIVGTLTAVLLNWDNFFGTLVKVGSKLHIFNTKFSAGCASINQYSVVQSFEFKSLGQRPSTSNDSMAYQSGTHQSPNKIHSSLNAPMVNLYLTNELPFQRPSTSNTSMVYQSITHGSPDQSHMNSNGMTIKRKRQDEIDQEILQKMKDLSNSGLSDKFQNLFDAIFNCIMNTETDDEISEFSPKRTK